MSLLSYSKKAPGLRKIIPLALGSLLAWGGRLHAQPTPAPARVFSVLAGQPGLAGSVDGLGRAASFTTPSSVAVDLAGNIFVADTADHTIRKLTRDGTVTTWAGRSRQPGGADGAREVARFNSPRDLAIDGAGNLYVADSGNHTIRKLTPDGVVSTLAGRAGVAGSADGDGADARFNHPTGVTVYPDGTAYVADQQNHLIREITPAGRVAVFSGKAGIRGNTNGARDQTLFTFPTHVAVYHGYLYVTGLETSAVRFISPTGLVATAAGDIDLVGSDDGAFNTARFAGPTGLAVDADGIVYIADSINATIRRMAPLGVVTTVAGRVRIDGADDGPARQATFDSPNGVAVDAAGNVIIADLGNGTIRQLSPSGVVTTLAGYASSGADDGTGSVARFRSPGGVAVDLAGNAYVADLFNSTIRRITPAGVVTTFAGVAGQSGSTDGTGSAARFDVPLGVAVDRVGNVYVTSNIGTVRKITPAGVVTTLAGSPGAIGYADGPGRTARFAIPNGLAVGADGTVYVADQENGAIRQIAPDGTVSTLAGSPPAAGGVDGTGRAARFIRPAGLAIDAAGNLYVSDLGDFTVRKVTPAGVVTTVAGQHGVRGTADGTGGAAQFAFAGGLAIDRTGTLFVADSNNRIRQITAAGAVTTLVADTPFPPPSSGGDDSQSTLVRAIATDLAGNLYVTDSANNTIRRGVSTTKLMDLAVRSRVGTGDQTLTMGFGIAAGNPPRVLVRGVGPTLSFYDVADPVADPQVRLLDVAGRSLQENDDWGGSTELSGLFALVGAFPLGSNSKDAALAATLPPQAYTVQISAKGAAGGVSEAEVYDVSAGPAGNLINVSARSVTGTGEDVLIGGFVLSGTAPKTVLIRGIGPALTKFGVNAASVVADPRLTLYHSETIVGENDNWGGTAELKAAFKTVGAFDLDSDTSKDAAFLVTLPPGGYSVIVAGTNATTGVALVEVYVLP